MQLGKKQATLRVVAITTPRREHSLPFHFAVALPKGDRGDFLLEKLTELGIAEFTPLVVERGVVKPDATKTEKLRRAVIEASKQCGRNVFMRVNPPAKWSEWCGTVSGSRFIAQPGGSQQQQYREAATFAIGPEGGFTEAERGEVTGVTRIRRQVPFGQPNNFGIQTADSIIDTFRSITFGVALAMIAISSVGLMVGGIGVMNIMLVSVTERTKEIGIRKAIGGRRRDIMWQFLIEAMTLTGLGGVIGLFFGWLVTLLVKLIVPSYVPLWAPIAGFMSSVGIGLIFGLWPAWKAARLDPIEALRYE